MKKFNENKESNEEKATSDYSMVAGYIRSNSPNSVSNTSGSNKSDSANSDFKKVESIDSILDSNLPFNVYKKKVLVHFKNKIRSKGYTFKLNEENREIYAPEIAELLKENLIPKTTFIQKNIIDISDVFYNIGLSDSNSKEETQKLLDLLTKQNYKIIGYPVSIGIFKAINLIFERHGSNYNIYDTGIVSQKILSSYIKNDENK